MLLWSVCFVVGYKCRVDDNSWTGANRKILENELAHKRLLLHNIQDFDVLCQKAGVESVIEVRAAVHPRIVAVDEARTYGAYHVVLDRFFYCLFCLWLTHICVHFQFHAICPL
jgi:hypothetical protein